MHLPTVMHQLEICSKSRTDGCATGSYSHTHLRTGNSNHKLSDAARSEHTQTKQLPCHQEEVESFVIGTTGPALVCQLSLLGKRDQPSARPK
jgi:hypothetical protein